MIEIPPQDAAAGTVGGPGLLQSEGSQASVVFRRLLGHPIQDVWDAITDPAQIEAWFMAKVTREDRAGGRLEMEHPNHVRASGQVLEWRPPRIYEYEWNLPVDAAHPEGESSVVRWELTPADGGTLLVLTHRKLTRPTAAVFSRGLRSFLDRLAAHLDGAPLPDPPWLAPSRRAESAPPRS